MGVLRVRFATESTEGGWAFLVDFRVGDATVWDEGVASSLRSAFFLDFGLSFVVELFSDDLALVVDLS